MIDKMVSVIIPVYNVAKYLSRCVESIINQTYKNLEIILIDDGSTDASPQICDKYATRDERITVIHKKNKGLSATRNVGIKFAHGEYIVFVDSDDWIDLDTIEILTGKAISTDSDIIAHAVCKNRQGKDYLVLPTDQEEYKVDVTKYKKFLYISCLLNQSGFSYLYPRELLCGPEMSYPVLKLFKKSFIDENGLLFPEGLRFCEDKVFELDVVKATKTLYYINKPYYHYFMRPGSLSNRGAEEKSEDYLETFHYLEEKMKDLGIFNELEKYFGLNILSSCWNITERYGMEVINGKDFLKASKQLKQFLEKEYCKTAIQQMDFSLIHGYKHILLTILLKYRLYKTAVFICCVYYKLNPHKNVFKES